MYIQMKTREMTRGKTKAKYVWSIILIANISGQFEFLSEYMCDSAFFGVRMRLIEMSSSAFGRLDIKQKIAHTNATHTDGHGVETCRTNAHQPCVYGIAATSSYNHNNGYN